MHLITTNCFQIILINILFQSVVFIFTPQDYPLLITSLHREVNELMTQKCSLQHTILLSLLQPLPVKSSLRTTCYMNKIRNQALPTNAITLCNSFSIVLCFFYFTTCFSY